MMRYDLALYALFVVLVLQSYTYLSRTSTARYDRANFLLSLARLHLKLYDAGNAEVRALIASYDFEGIRCVVFDSTGMYVMPHRTEPDEAQSRLLSIAKSSLNRVSYDHLHAHRYASLRLCAVSAAASDDHTLVVFMPV